MKKAKIMLMAIAIVGVIGGALAFKAAKFSGTLYVCTTTVAQGPTICIQPGYITTIPGKGFVSTVYTTTSAIPNNFCSSTASNGVTYYCASQLVATVTTNAGE